MEVGDEVTPFYDPMIAKVIAHGATRDQALDRLATALGETVVAGPKTNVAFLKALCEADGFRTGPFDTGFIDRNLQALGAAPQPIDHEAVRIGVLKLLDMDQQRRANEQFGPTEERHSPWNATDGFQLGGPRRQQLGIEVDGERIDVTLAWRASAQGRTDSSVEVHYGGGMSRLMLDYHPGKVGGFTVRTDGVLVVRNGRQTRVALYDPFAIDLEHMDEGGSVKAPMHGKLIAVFVQPGDRVEKGQRLAIVEAMKMEHALVAPSAGEVTEIAAEPGAQVAEGARLIVLKADE